MKIKHFSGFGSVEVKKVFKHKYINGFGEDKTKLVVHVKGNHDWGLICDEIFDAQSWLMTKFERRFINTDDIYMKLESGCKEEKGEEVEYAVYTFVY